MMLHLVAITFEPKADLSDILTLLAIVISAYFGIRAMLDAAGTERKANTQRMLNRWNSERLTEHRTTAARVLRERKTSSSDRIFVGDLMRLKPRSSEYAALSELGHFFADLYSLWQEGALDDRLGCALFYRPVEFFWQFFPLIDSRESESDTSPRAAHTNAWRQVYVLPLHDQVQSAAKRCGFRRPPSIDPL